MSFCSSCGHKLIASTPPHCTKCKTPQYQNPTPVAVAVTPVLKDGEVVGVVGVKRSSVTGMGAGKWALPGGYVDMGESAQQASLRELQEETSLVPDGPTKVLDSAISSNGKTLLIFVETSPVNYEQLLSCQVSDECEQAGVLTKDSQLAFSTHQDVLEQFLSTIPQNQPKITPRKSFP